MFHSAAVTLLSYHRRHMKGTPLFQSTEHFTLILKVFSDKNQIKNMNIANAITGLM